MASCNKFSCNTHLIRRYFYTVLLLRVYRLLAIGRFILPFQHLHYTIKRSLRVVLASWNILASLYRNTNSVGNLLFNALRTAAIRQKFIQATLLIFLQGKVQRIHLKRAQHVLLYISCIHRDGDCMINIAFRSGSTVSKVHTLCTTFHIPPRNTMYVTQLF